MGYWFSNFQSESDSRNWTCIFLRAKKMVGENCSDGIRLLFFCNLIFPPKNGKTFCLGISGNSFLCRACNKATRSHSSTVSSRSTAIATGASPVVVSTNHDNHTTNTSQVTQDDFFGGGSGHLVLLQISDPFGMLVG